MVGRMLKFPADPIESGSTGSLIESVSPEVSLPGSRVVSWRHGDREMLVEGAEGKPRRVVSVGGEKLFCFI